MWINSHANKNYFFKSILWGKWRELAQLVKFKERHNEIGSKFLSEQIMSWLWTPFIIHLVLVIFCVILAECLCLFWVSCCGWTWRLWLAGAPAAHLLIGASSKEPVFSSLAARALISLRSGIDGFTLQVTSSSLLEIYFVLSETYLYLSSQLLEFVTTSSSASVTSKATTGILATRSAEPPPEPPAEPPHGSPAKSAAQPHASLCSYYLICFFFTTKSFKHFPCLGFRF